MSLEDRVVFREVQRMRQWWVWGMICVVAAFAWYGFVKQIVLGEPFGTQPVSDVVMGIIWIVTGMGLPVFAWGFRLVTTVDDRGIHVQLPLFGQHSISHGDLKRFEIRRYRPIAEYWGWGVRWSWRHGLAYTMMGDRGVQCELTSGKRILIGTQQPDDFVAAIRSQATRAS